MPESVDLNKLTQKELLIVTYRELQGLSATVGDMKERQGRHEVRLSLVESKVKGWGAVLGAIFGTVFGTISGVLVSMINRQ